MVGYSTSRLREATEARAAAERIAATMQERARLARVVHDGVLQVLALVQRRGLEAGGDVAELGRLAGEQEVALRALVQGDSAALTAGPSSGGTAVGDEVDLVERLLPLATRSVTVSGPGGAVLLPAPVAEELTAVVRACLDNVARHVGEGAPGLGAGGGPGRHGRGDGARRGARASPRGGWRPRSARGGSGCGSPCAAGSPTSAGRPPW